MTKTPLEMLREVAEELFGGKWRGHSAFKSSAKPARFVAPLEPGEKPLWPDSLDTIARLVERMSVTQLEKYADVLREQFNAEYTTANDYAWLMRLPPESHLRAIHAAVCGEGEAAEGEKQ